MRICIDKKSEPLVLIFYCGWTRSKTQYEVLHFVYHAEAELQRDENRLRKSLAQRSRRFATANRRRTGRDSNPQPLP